MGSARGCHSELKTGFKELHDSLSDTAQLPLQCLQCCQPWGVQCGQDAGLPPVPPSKSGCNRVSARQGPVSAWASQRAQRLAAKSRGGGGVDY